MKDNALLMVGVSGSILCILIYLGFHFNLGGIASWFLNLFNIG